MADFQRESKTFAEALTFARASSGTYFDNTGTLQTAAVDEPRFDHDPATFEALGLLIEEQRTNLVAYSEDLTQANWTKTRLTITGDSSTAPDGIATADKVVPDTQDNAHDLGQNVGVSAGTDYTFSVFVKAAEYSDVQFIFTGSGKATQVVPNPNETLLSNGWRRLDTLVDSESATTLFCRVRVVNASGETSYAGDGSSGLFVWGAQLEQGAFPTSYIKTEGSQVTRSADSCSRTLGAEFNVDEITFFYHGFVLPPDTGGRGVFASDLTGGAANRGLGITCRDEDVINIGIRDNAESALLSYILPEVGGAEIKAAISMKGRNIIACLNGETKTLTTSQLFDLSEFNQTLQIAGSQFQTGVPSPNWNYQKPKRCLIYPRAFTAAELEELTAP